MPAHWSTHNLDTINLATGQNSYNCQEDSCINPVADNYFSVEGIYSLCQEEAVIMQERDQFGRFVKGMPSWNKGMHGRYTVKRTTSVSDATRKKQSDSHLGYVMPIEQKLKISASNKGKKKPPFTQEHKNKIKDARAKQVISKEHFEKMSSRRWEGWTVKIPALCACGCNEVVWDGNTYVHGHNPSWNKGVKNCYSESARRGMSIHHADFRGNKHGNWKGGKKAELARMHARRRKMGFTLVTDKNPYNETIEYHHVHPGLPYVIPCPKRIHQMFNGIERNHHNNVNAMLGIRIDIDLLKEMK